MADERLCSIPDCNKPAKARGWCSRHHTRWLRHGSPSRERVKKFCTVDDCKKPHAANGLCMMHYVRLRNNGTIHLQPTDKLQFIQNALVSNTDECIVWPFPDVQRGYGRVRINGKSFQAHRFVCIESHGHAPRDRPQAAHFCGNRLCINPRHLRWATSRENAADRKLHGTERYGNQVHSTKLSEADVRLIRSLRATMSIAKLAEKFGVAPNAIRSVLVGDTWGWLS